jgi:hypothetical protein
MSIQKQIILRHREKGYLRFDLPVDLINSDTGQKLVTQLRTIEGIYRVSLAQRAGKLTIRFLETTISFEKLIRQIYELIGKLVIEAKTRSSQPQNPHENLADKEHQNGFLLNLAQGSSTLVEWLRAKLLEIKETIQAMGILIKQGISSMGTRPVWLKEFANDLLMLFLIRIHWVEITTLWLLKPWTYRYEWLATFYMTYLLVQSKLPPKG